jgi:phosphatidylglycerol:prolipoprotein diacylglycerol transferase
MRPWVVELMQQHGLAGIAWLVPTPGAVYGATMLVVVIAFLARATRIGLPPSRALSACIAGTLGVIVGGHLYYALDTGSLATAGPVDWVTREGAGSWGGYLGCTLAMAAYLKWQRLEAWPYLDVLGSVGALAAAVGRWGCLLAGCDFGRITSVPWAVHYPPGSLAFRAHAASGTLPLEATQSLAVHPLTIYLSLNGLLVFLAVSAVWRRWRRVPGVTLASFWVLYGTTRFCWEFLRDPAAGGAVSGLSLPQYMALASIGIGGTIALRGARRVSRRAHSSAPAATA